MKWLLFIVPLLLISLLAAIWGGWLRMGWDLPYTAMAVQHGSLMVNAFLASLIFLERAVTFRSRWVLLLPFVNAFSLICYASGNPEAAMICTIAGSSGFVIMCAYFVWKYKELYYYIFLLGAACLLTGNLFLFSSSLYAGAVQWWMGFLLFTIVAERIELSRFLSLKPYQVRLLLAALALVTVSFLLPGNAGSILFAAGLTATAAWLLRFDMARHAVRREGSHRYSGILLIAGYIWLPVTAAALLFRDYLPFYYDAVLHSFFIGFVFSMIFSHAPIILPAVARLPIRIYRPFLYFPFCLLQLTLMMRIWGDVSGNVVLRKWGGMGNGLSILLFFITIAVIVGSALQARRRQLKA